jgi:hypothetical protein
MRLLAATTVVLPSISSRAAGRQPAPPATMDAQQQQQQQQPGRPSRARQPPQLYVPAEDRRRSGDGTAGVARTAAQFDAAM